MGKQKKNKDKKDKKKNRDRDRSREKQRKDKKKKEKKRSYSSSSSSEDSSDDSSSSSQQRTKKKEHKIKKDKKKQSKPQAKPTNNPYDFDKTVSKPVPGFPVGLPTPGFTLPLIHTTPPPPITSVSTTKKTKTQQINIFKLLPKLPYGLVLFGKTLYSTQFIQQKAYNRLLKQMTQQIQSCVKPTGRKKATSIAAKLQAELQKIMAAEEQRKKSEVVVEGTSKSFLASQQGANQEVNRFTTLKNIYEQCFTTTV